MPPGAGEAESRAIWMYSAVESRELRAIISANIPVTIGVEKLVPPRSSRPYGFDARSVRSVPMTFVPGAAKSIAAP